ncbi:hypothetical protein EYF80_028386 [Liparis tanakae]|uniref:Uncharacterized protein n=1 Tax=Liparis tanakae TaxID=230148 RepID=A0A4Z2H6D1_9TELE|nr:hypothetical protein EYF80_028386 [Liparis tanakae]
MHHTSDPACTTPVTQHAPYRGRRASKELFNEVHSCPSDLWRCPGPESCARGCGLSLHDVVCPSMQDVVCPSRMWSVPPGRGLSLQDVVCLCRTWYSSEYTTTSTRSLNAHYALSGASYSTLNTSLTVFMWTEANLMNLTPPRREDERKEEELRTMERALYSWKPENP